MRISQSVAVGSPIARVAAIVAATLLLALSLAAAGVAGTRLLAAGPIVVDQGGAGDYTTIAEAVAEATDGTEILVMPGRYEGAIVIDKDISIRGEDRDTTIIESGMDCSVDGEDVTCPEAVPLYEAYWFGPKPFGLMLDDVDARLSDLTFDGTYFGGFIVAKGGSPTIERLTFTHQNEGLRGSIYIHDGSSAIVRDVDLGIGWIFVEEQSPATIEDSAFAATVVNTSNTARRGGPASIRNNVAHGIAFSGEAVVEGNTLLSQPGLEQGFYGSGIDVDFGTGWIIRDNVLEDFDSDAAIDVQAFATGAVTGNTIRGSQTAVRTGSDSTIEGNIVNGGDSGIVISGSLGGAPSVLDNTVEGVSGRGLEIGPGMNPTLSGNVSCGNGENLWVAGTAEPIIDDTNEICPDVAAAG